MTSLLNTRQLGRDAIVSTVDQRVYRENRAFANRLIDRVESHPLMRNPILSKMTSGEFDIQQMRVFHLEFYHAFAQVFTDAVIEALSAAKQLEAPLGAQAKMAARFLLQINLLDELGFHPGEDNEGNYNGQPALAHYVQFFNTIEQLGMTEQEVKAWLPMSSSLACRATFENAYGDYTRLVGLLAVAETVFHDFATPWAKGVDKATDIDVTQGYHSIHVESETGESIEDGHSEDAWILFCQAITEDRYREMEQHVDLWLKVWNDFCNDLLAGRAGK
ncbi:iron-containing redox enzyme family protein [Enterobacter cloacae]|uniref:iron-containing redox enzyme family protein n=1 Tax=Enterobacter cloacae TaxID=550 RepID=UPI001C5ACA84|nr:iron-containing redox enzyme family protein [Enterobacter cloacae]ELQ9014728.1 iron-containing redox enzyme family protein [Enterobacter cloacae]MBW4198689.1 iron-containing redox enzyme family protein [Enterobacter cloacae subsp. cloacae]